jgi:hypothetical protein
MARRYGNVPNWPPAGPGGVVVMRPRRRPRKRRVRWNIFWIPGVLSLGVWVVNSVSPSSSWGGIMDGLHIRNRERFSMLAILFVLIVTVLLIALVVRKRKFRASEATVRRRCAKLTLGGGGTRHVHLLAVCLHNIRWGRRSTQCNGRRKQGAVRQLPLRLEAKLPEGREVSALRQQCDDMQMIPLFRSRRIPPPASVFAPEFHYWRGRKAGDESGPRCSEPDLS